MNNTLKIPSSCRTQAGKYPLEWLGHGRLLLKGTYWKHKNEGLGPVIFLHGGGQTRHAWTGTAERLASHGFDVLTFDTRGHGDSEWALDGDYSVDTLIDDASALLQLEQRTPILVGASMGGITAMLGVGEQRLRCQALVLVDIAPRIEHKGVARIVSFMRGYPEGFSSLEEARSAVIAYNPHRQQAGDSKGLHKNLRLCHDGRYRWHWDPRLLDHPERADPTQMELQQERRITAARHIQVPTLLIRGSKSDIVSDDGVRELRELIPHADIVELPQAGHMVAGDRNDIFSEAILTFLTDIKQTAPTSRNTLCL